MPVPPNMAGAGIMSGRAVSPARSAEWRVTLSPAARRALDARAAPLYVEMELFFSCLIRKRLLWDRPPPADTVPLSSADGHPQLVVWFHPVMARHCALPNDAALEDLPLMDFPLSRREAFRPHWLRLDYRDGAFCGEFGW